MKKTLFIIGLLIASLAAMGQTHVKQGLRVSAKADTDAPVIDSIEIVGGLLTFYIDGTAYYGGADSVALGDVAPLLEDTGTICAFIGGAGNDGDTAKFTTDAIYGSFLWEGPDTLVITKINGVMQQAGTSPDLYVDIQWHATLNSPLSTHLLDADLHVTSTSIGDPRTSFSENDIPPGVRVWMETPTINTKPTYLEVTLIGYRKNGN